MKTRHTEGNPTEARAAAICQRLQITRQDLARMTLAAGLDAIEARLATAGEITLPLALEISTGTATPPPRVLIPVSVYHLEGMRVAAWCKGNDTAHSWASRVLSARRLPKPARPYSFPDRPTGRLLKVTVSRERLDELKARASRDGLPLDEWIHAALVAASRKYRATLDCQASAETRPDIEPAPPPPFAENVLPFFTGHFRRA